MYLNGTLFFASVIRLEGLRVLLDIKINQIIEGVI